MQLVRYSDFTLTENKVKWRKDVKIMSVWFRIKETSLKKYRIFMGIPVKCETKSKRNETKRNEINRNEIHRKEIYLVSFRFRFVSVNFVSFRFISFRFVSISFRILQVPRCMSNIYDNIVWKHNLQCCLISIRENKKMAAIGSASWNCHQCFSL